MPTEWIDIVDTAVKIGLGALISGYATYKVTNLNNSYESNENKRNKKIEVIESISLDFDTYLGAIYDTLNITLSCSRAYPSITNLSDNSNADAVFNRRAIQDRFHETQKTSEVHDSLVSRLELLQFQEPKECVYMVQDMHELIREQFLRKKTMLSEAEILKLMDELSVIKNDFYVHISKHYDI